jgi:acetolactate synthase-1/2/3 large subunit
MKVSDYIIERIARETKHVFMVVGGGGMHLFDSLGKNKSMQYVCNHHEQASAIAAEGYARTTGKLGVCMVSTGPAGTNCVTGVGCAWNDFVPVLFISGQANSKVLVNGRNIRQGGVQEVDIVSVVRPITKFAKTIMSADEVELVMEQAIFLAKNGAPGPVWVDVPLNIQASQMEVKGVHLPERIYAEASVIPVNSKYVHRIVKELKESKKPAILIGHGVRITNAMKELIAFSHLHNIPIITSKNGFDCVYNSFPNFMGQIGINGTLAGNKVVQECDFLLVLGCRLSVPTTGYSRNLFAKDAYKVLIDMSMEENSGIDIDIFVRGDISSYLREISAAIGEQPLTSWITHCRDLRSSFPPVKSEWRVNKEYVDPYVFFDVLSKYTKTQDTLIVDQGATFYCSTVAYKVKENQRAFTNGGFSPMGWGLPAAIGSYFATGNRVICVHGDGGLQMNLQELQTMFHHKCKIKLFVFNNEGYLSIKHTQTMNCDGHLMGCDKSSGLTLPSTEKIAKAYGFNYYRITDTTQIESALEDILLDDEMQIIEVFLHPMQPYTPKVVSYKNAAGQMVSPALDDMR